MQIPSDPNPIRLHSTPIPLHRNFIQIASKFHRNLIESPVLSIPTSHLPGNKYVGRTDIWPKLSGFLSSVKKPQKCSKRYKFQPTTIQTPIQLPYNFYPTSSSSLPTPIQFKQNLVKISSKFHLIESPVLDASPLSGKSTIDGRTPDRN